MYNGGGVRFCGLVAFLGFGWSFLAGWFGLFALFLGSLLFPTAESDGVDRPKQALV